MSLDFCVNGEATSRTDAPFLTSQTAEAQQFETLNSSYVIRLTSFTAAGLFLLLCLHEILSGFYEQTTKKV